MRCIIQQGFWLFTALILLMYRLWRLSHLRWAVHHAWQHLYLRSAANAVIRVCLSLQAMS